MAEHRGVLLVTGPGRLRVGCTTFRLLPCQLSCCQWKPRDSDAGRELHLVAPCPGTTPASSPLPLRGGGGGVRFRVGSHAGATVPLMEAGPRPVRRGWPTTPLPPRPGGRRRRPARTASLRTLSRGERGAGCWPRAGRGRGAAACQRRKDAKSTGNRAGLVPPRGRDAASPGPPASPSPGGSRLSET